MGRTGRGWVAEMPMGRCWKSQKVCAPRDCAWCAQAKPCVSRTSKRATIIPRQAIFVPDSMGWVTAGGTLQAAGTGDAGSLTLVDEGLLASYEKDENCKLLRLITQRWGCHLLHVFDRGYCGSRGWGRCGASRPVLSCAGKPPIICLMPTGSNKRRGKLPGETRRPRTILTRASPQCGRQRVFSRDPSRLSRLGLDPGGGPTQRWHAWYLLTNEVVETALMPGAW